MTQPVKISAKTINTILIGVQKAGTSSLFNWLAQHPEVYAPVEMKDFHFFTLDNFYSKGESYLHSFYTNVNKEKIILKGAVNYFFFPFAAKRLYEYNPDLKLILILRNPIDRAISAYNYFYKMGIENLSFKDALNREDNNKLNTTEELSNFTYIAHGKYATQLKDYFKYFSKNQIHIIIYEEMVEKKKETMVSFFEFLEINPDFIPTYTYVNKTGSVKYRWLNKFLFAEHKMKKITKKILHSIVPLEKRIMLGNWMREKNMVTSNISKNEKLNKLLIQDRFREEILELEKILNRDLSVWRTSTIKADTI